MVLYLPDEDWMTVLLALRRAEHGKRILRIEDQTACGDVGRQIERAVRDVVELRGFERAIATVTVRGPASAPAPARAPTPVTPPKPGLLRSLFWGE